MASQTRIRSPLLFLAAIATAAAKLTPEWRVVSAAKGVTTRARIDATSQLCAVHGEAVVEASVAELMSVFGDLDQHGHWDATLVDAGDLWFPVVIVENVYIFPGIPSLLERAFTGLSHLFAG